MRRAFSDSLLKIARQDERVIFLTGDLGFQVFDDFVAEFPKRYLNMGVAEAQMVDCAAGLALEGWKPIVYSIASFMTGRAFEQIRLSLGYHNLTTVVVGAGGGYGYAASGVTHHAKEDMALMSLVPNFSVVNPGDPTEVTELLPQLLNLPGPSYMRVGKFGEPKVPSVEPIVLGKGRLIRPGERVAFLTTGSSLVQATEAADRLAAEGKRPVVCHFHTVKPLDTALLADVAAQVNTIIAVEDHGLMGGLRNAVVQFLAGLANRPRVVGVGPDDGMILGNPTQAEIMARFGMGTDALVTICRDLWTSS